MSHFATYECKASRIDFIQRALKEMGFNYTGPTTITDYYGQERHVELALKKDDHILPVGWSKNDREGLELQADWFGIGMSEESFTNEIGQLHSKYQVLESCEDNGWEVDEDSITTNQNGEIELVATQYN